MAVLNGLAGDATYLLAISLLALIAADAAPIGPVMALMMILFNTIGRVNGFWLEIGNCLSAGIVGWTIFDVTADGYTERWLKKAANWLLLVIVLACVGPTLWDLCGWAPLLPGLISREICRLKC